MITLLFFLLLITLIVLYYLIKLRYQVAGIASHLQGAAWDLVRLMENNPRSTPSKTRKRWQQEFQALVLQSAAELTRMPSAYYGKLDQPIALTGAIDTLRKGDEETSAFWFKVQGIRNGVQIFYDIMVLRNPGAAFVRMIDHMRRQRDEFENKGKKGSPNLTELKIVLELPTEWPVGDLPEQCLKRGLREAQAENIISAARRHKTFILSELIYKPWPSPDEPERVEEFQGDDLLAAMRNYVR